MTEFWWRDGACAQIGADLFFVGKGESTLGAQHACHICPVRVQCLADALEREVDYGIFGGFTPPVRHALATHITASCDAHTVARAAIHHDRSTPWKR